LGGGGAMGPAGHDGHLTFYVEVPDVGETLAKAEQLGGQRLFGPDEVPGMDMVLGQFTDPEGHLIGLIQS
jgi:predicted enzyme related to lactoylglutathione lyase